MQRVTPDIGGAFVLVDTDLQDAFLLYLFYGIRERTPRQGVSCLSVKQAVMDLPDPTKTAP